MLFAYVRGYLENGSVLLSSSWSCPKDRRTILTALFEVVTSYGSGIQPGVCIPPEYAKTYYGVCEIEKKNYYCVINTEYSGPDLGLATRDLDVRTLVS
jgi:hypothetical protein